MNKYKNYILKKMIGSIGFIFLCTLNVYSVNQAVLILGMHRSGTSATTGVLGILGLYLGNQLLEGHKFNLKGHFEDLPTLNLNDEILKELKSSWDDTGVLDLNISSAEANKFRDSIKNNLSPRLTSHEFFGLKEPRLCLLLPYYLDVLKELNFNCKLVIVLRHPIEIAQSLKKRDKMNFDKAVNLINKYLNAVKNYTIGYDCLFVKYDDLLNDLSLTLYRLQKFLSQLEVNEDNINKIHDFLDSDLKHNLTNETDSVLDVYNEFLQLYEEQVKRDTELLH